MKTRPKEFIKFIKLLLKKAPEGYIPHLFRCQKNSKAPKLSYGSWKDEQQRISPRKAVKWLKNHGNVGIAGMPNDSLVNVDIDDEEKTNKEDLKPTLMARSRSRTGVHAWYFSKEDIPNIPTDNAGEIRAEGQYVVAPGSYVPCEKDLKNAGYYTVEETTPVSWIDFDELPQVFLERHEENQEEKQKPEPSKSEYDPKESNGEESAVFGVEARDVITMEGGNTEPTDRWTAIFHDSTTGKNMSFSNGLLHCWRHLVSHNGLQALTVLSGYMTCERAGSPHKKSNAGPSRIVGDNGAIFHSWLYAKKQGYIPENDKIPVKGLKYISRKHGIYKPENGEQLPKWAYNQVIDIVEEKY